MELVVIRRLFYAPRVDRARRDHRHLGSRARDRHRVPGDHRLRRDVPAGGRQHVERRARRAGHRRAARRPRGGAGRRACARLVPQPHAGRAHGEGIGREPRPRAVQGINPKLVSTAVWAIAGFAGHALDGAGRRRQRRRRTRPRSRSGRTRCVRALAAAVIAGMVSFPRAMLAGHRHRRRASADQLQLPRQARPHRRSAASWPC